MDTTTEYASRFLADWTPRIGPEAAETLRRSSQFKTYAFILIALFLTSEMGSQFADSRVGITASAFLFIPAIYCFVKWARLVVLACKRAGVYLGLTPYEAKYMRLRFTSTFDMWISKRDHPKFPKVTRFD